VAVRNELQYFRRSIIGGYQNGSRTSYALDTNFTLASAGKSIGLRVVAPADTTITDVLFFLTAAPGTARNLRVYLCEANTAYGLRPGTVKTYVDVPGGTTADRWLKTTFTADNAVTRGYTYWIVIGDPAGAASGYGILSRSGSTIGYAEQAYTLLSSSDGLASNGAGISGPHAWIVKYGNGQVCGNPITQSSTWAASTAGERGIKVGPLDFDVSIATSAWAPFGDSDAKYLRCYEDDVTPGGTIYPGFNGGSQYTIPSAIRFGLGETSVGDVRLRRGHSYRFTIAGDGGGFAGPYYGYCEDPSADLSAFLACMSALTPCFATIASGGAWITYDNATDGLWVPLISLWIGEFPNVRNMAKAARLIGAGEL